MNPRDLHEHQLAEVAVRRARKWTWAAGGMVILAVGFLFWLYRAQQAQLHQTAETIESVRAARANLALGAIHAHTARPGAQHDYDVGGALALVDQSYEALRSVLGEPGEAKDLSGEPALNSSELARCWAAFRQALQTLPASTEDDGLLRLKYEAMERVAEREEVVLRQRLTELRQREDSQFAGALVGVAALLILVGAGVLVSSREAFRTSEAAHRAGELLRESEALLRSYFDEAPIAVFIADGDGILVDCNREAAEMTNRSREQMLGKPVMEFHPERDRATGRELFERLQREGRVQMEIDLLRVGGDDLHVVLRAVRLGSGRSIGFCVDVTERRRAEEALRHSHAQMRSLVEQAPLSMAMFDREMRYLVTSRRWLDDYGRGRESVIGLGHYDLFPDLPEAWKAVHRRGLAGETIRNDDDMWVQGDGARQWLRWVVQPWRDGRGEIGGIIIAAENITPRRLAEEKLRESEARLRAIGDNLPDSYVYRYTHDEDGRPRFLYLGAGVEQIHGRKVAEALADAGVLRRQIPAGEEAILTQLEAESRRTMTDFDFDFRFMPPDGGVRWLHVRSRPSRSAAGRVEWDGVATDVTAQKRAAEALRESEERFRTLITLSPDVVFINQGDRVVYINPSGVALWRAKSEEELLGRNPVVLFHPDWRDLVRERIRRLWEQGGRAPLLEMRILAFDGAAVDVETVAAVFDYRGARAIQVVMREITQRKQAQRVIEEQKALMEETGRIAKVGGWSFDPVTGVGTWTPEVARIHDLDPAVATSRDVGLSFYTPESRQRIEAAIKAALEERKPYDLELEMRTAKGARKWVRTIGHVTWEHGRVTRLHGSFQDITETRRTEAALRESEGRMKAIVENMREGLVVADMDGAMVYWNPAAMRMHGFRPDEDMRGWLGDYQKIFELSTPEGKVLAVEEWPMARLLRDEPVSDLEVHLRRIGSDWTRVFRYNGTLAREAEGRQLAVLTFRDITEYKRLEQQFLRAQRLEAIGTLAGGVAHDLNNILAPVLMAAGLLSSSMETEDDRNILVMIEQSARRGAGIVRQLLTFSRGIEGARSTVQPRHLVKEMGVLIRETFPRNITLNQQFDSGLWNVIADATQLDQVIMNLCVNARDAMPEGGTLTTALENVQVDEAMAEAHPPLRAGPHVLLKVADTGEGIPPAIIDRIFDPFFTTKGVGKGTGLGLSTVLGIVKSHGGYVSVYSEPGRGAEFRVYLPAVREEATAAVVPVPGALPRGRGELLLLVDDEAPIRETMRRMLERQNYRVVPAKDGQEALALFVQHAEVVALVITDMMMPGMGGGTLVQSLRVLNQELRIVATSGMDQPDEVREKLVKLGVTEFVRKPCTAEVLLRAIERVMAT